MDLRVDRSQAVVIYGSGPRHRCLENDNGMDRVLLLSLLWPLGPSVAPPPVETVPLDEVLMAGAVTLRGQGLGGHTNECLMVELVNHTDRPLETTIPAGWLMKNSDPEGQDLMIVDRVPVRLAPRGTHRATCRAFCVESGDRSPSAGVPFSSLGLACPAWVRLADHLVRNKINPDDAQAAVWAVANAHTIAAISTAAISLRQFVADLTGREVPWYGLSYAPPTEDGQVFSALPTTMQGTVHFELNTQGRITALIHDAGGRLVYTIGKPRYLGPGTYSMELVVTVRGWPHGSYSVSYYLDDSRLLKRLRFEV